MTAASPAALKELDEGAYSETNILQYQYLTIESSDAGRILPAIIVTPDNFGYIKESAAMFLKLAEKYIALHIT